MSSATALADAGVQAIAAGKYSEGIEKLTAALKERDAPLWYLERSKAYLRTSQFDLALHDAETALQVALKRANRDQMVEAQLRRAIALFRMGQFADADICAFWALRLADGAKAMEDDGQQRRVDDNGDYAVRRQEVQDEAKLKKGDGLGTALSGGGKRRKTSSLEDQAITWRLQALDRLETLPAGHEGRKVRYASSKYPDPSKAKQEPAAVSSTADASSPAAAANTSPAGAADLGAWEDVYNKYHAMYTKQKIRYSFYQTDSSLTIDIFVKGLTSEKVSINCESRAISISPVQGASLGTFGGSICLLLAGDIKPEATKVQVKSMKIELVLQKQTPGKWGTIRQGDSAMVDNLSSNPTESVTFNQFHSFVQNLGYQHVSELKLPDFDDDSSRWYVALLDELRSRIAKKQPGVDAPVPISSGTAPPPLSKGDAKAVETPAGKPAAAAAPSPSAPQVSPPQASSKGPAYPTSSKKGPKDWDHIDDGDEDEDPSKNGDVNSFFQQIYQGADDDTRRAMMKSFIESNGTALSTSWDDAKNKTYKTQPPEGAEAKKWEK
ncbi:SGS-domain-containing protein [Xylariaceae sp. FL0594]|nr:SGS-domain-containing protein [Xylariaceae sp. FL0594]